MRQRMLAGGVATVLALVLAGCSGTGNFDIQQTEPFRVQLEGEPRTVVVDETDDEPQEVVIVTCQECEDDNVPDRGDDDDNGRDDDAPRQVHVKVHIKPQSGDACIIKVIIKDRVTGEVYEERQIDTGRDRDDDEDEDDGEDDNRTVTRTQTVTQTQTRSSGITIEDFTINVNGNNNLVVLTQAVQGRADVDISARNVASQVDTDGDAQGNATVSASASGTTRP